MHPTRVTLRPLYSKSTAPSIRLTATSTKQRWTIGRVAPCDLILDSSVKPQMIGRRHAEIIFEPCDERLQQWKVDSGDASAMDTTPTPASAAAAAHHSSPVCSCHWRLVDLHSINGCFLNDIKTTESLLHHGDILVLGHGNNLAPGTVKKFVDEELMFRFEDANITARIDSQASATHGDGSQMSDILPHSVASHKRKHSDSSSAAATVDFESAARARSAAQQAAHQKEMEAREAELTAEIESKAAAAAKERDRKDEECERERREEERKERERKAKAAEQEKRRAEEEAKRTKLREEQEAKERATHAAAAASAASAAAPAVPSDSPDAPTELPTDQDALDALAQNHSCPICNHLLLYYDSLPCKHLVCHACMLEWFSRGKTVCPECTSEIDFAYDYHPPPFPPENEPRKYDRIIGLLAESYLKPSEKEARQREFEALSKKVARDARRDEELRRCMANARKLNSQVLDVRDQWKAGERETYTTGISTYTYNGRLLYASFVGLTIPFLKSISTLHLLQRVMNNISLPVPSEVEDEIASIPDVMREVDFEDEEQSAMFSAEQRKALQKCKRAIYHEIVFGTQKKK